MFLDEQHQSRVWNIGHHDDSRRNPTWVSIVSLRSNRLVTRPSGGNRDSGVGHMLCCAALRWCSASRSALHVGGAPVVGGWSGKGRPPIF